jgi:hypothetical protein
MSLNHHLLLLDVDGVLLEAYGYLRALQDTVAFFSTQMGVGTHPPTEAEVRVFEAQGITSEWDSVPMCVAALLIERLRREPERILPTAWDEALSVLAASPLPLPRPDYERIAVRVGSRLDDGSTATAHVARAVLWEDAQGLTTPQREALRPILDILLGDTHNFAHAPTTRHFQTRTIGGHGLRQAYGVAPAFESPPYLRQYDHLYLTDEVRDRVLDAIAEGVVGAAIYTARPSLPPADADVSPLGYSPEAELACSALGLGDVANATESASIYRLPLIGLGRMHWLAQEMGTETALLVKPSPVQALAAIGAASSGLEAASLKAAFRLYCDGELTPPLANLGATEADVLTHVRRRSPTVAEYPIKVSVFEDTVTGLRAVQQAVEILQEAGLAVVYQPYGIAPAGSAKAEAMNALESLNDTHVPVYDSVNTAICEALA